MTPAQIAAALTPAHVRALRLLVDQPVKVSKWKCTAATAKALLDNKTVVPSLAVASGVFAAITPLGLAVLAELDKGVTA